MKEIKIWQKAICTRLNWDKFTVRVDSIWKDDESELFYILEILDWEHKGKFSMLLDFEFDSSIEFIN